MGEREADEARRRAMLARRAELRRRQVRRRRLTALAVLVTVAAVLAAALWQPWASAGGGRAAGGRTKATLPSTRPASDPAGSTHTAPRRPHGTLTVAAVGDTMLGSTPTLPPDPASYLSAAAPLLRGQVVYGNLEGTLTDQTASKCGAGSSACFAFRVPPSYARYLRTAGFTVMGNANNHAYDFGAAGLSDTLRALDAAGIAHTGRPGEVTVVRAGSLRVALVAFAPYPNTAPLTDLPAARRLIERADRRADIVIVGMHAGAEGTAAQHLTGAEETYYGEDRGDPEAFARMAVDAGADLVLGSGPHVLRAMEIYRHRLIAYSLGNFAGYHNFTLEGPLGVSCVLHVRLAADGRLLSGRVQSVRLVGDGQPVPDSSGAAAQLVAQLSREDLGARGVRVTAGGWIRTG